MKQLFTTMMGAVLISMTACDQGSRSNDQKPRSDTTVVPEALTGTKKYDFLYPGVFENIRETKRKLFLDHRIPDTALLSAPLQLTFAREYVQAFNKFTPLASGVERISPFFDFNDTTLQAFSDLYRSGQINGIRVYLAKYTGDQLDYRNSGLSRYTVILVGTKDSSRIPVDQFIRSSINPDLMASVQDYTNPCTPSPCPATPGGKIASKLEPG